MKTAVELQPASSNATSASFEVPVHNFDDGGGTDFDGISSITSVRFPGEGGRHQWCRRTISGPQELPKALPQVDGADQEIKKTAFLSPLVFG